MKAKETPEQIASRIVSRLSFSSNRIVNGRMIGEQYFAALAIAEAIQQERDDAIPVGHAVVPRSPTREMIRAYIDADPRRRRFAATAKRDYRAMLSAATKQEKA